MGDPYVGEIRMFAGTFAPLNWNFCNGQLIAISQNTALYTLLGTTYGGDGQSTFGLPDLRSRVPVHQGTLGTQPFIIGQIAGAEGISLTTQQMPSHSHAIFASTTGQVQTPSANVIPTQATTSDPGSANIYAPTPPGQNQNLHPATIANDGASEPHSNIQPYLAINYIISLYGTFPPRS